MRALGARGLGSIPSSPTLQLVQASIDLAVAFYSLVLVVSLFTLSPPNGPNHSQQSDTTKHLINKPSSGLNSLILARFCASKQF